MKSTIYLFPAVLFSIVALFGAADVIGGLHDVDTFLGLFVFAALAALCWRGWFRARRRNAPPPEAGPTPRKGLSKKERRKARREAA